MKLNSFLAVALLLVLAGSARAELRVWTLTETRHVLRSEAPGSSAVVRLYAARNEWASFQILLRADATVSGIGLAAGDLNGPGDSLLRQGDARLYRQHQLHLDTGTYRNESFKPDWYPDPL